MKATLSFALATIAAAVFVLALSPAAMADSGDTKSYSYWSIPIGDAVGTMEITADTDIAALKEQAISSGEASAGYDNVVKARLAQAENDSGQYFLVWKVVTNNGDSTFTKYIVDAGSGELLTSMTHEGGGCGSHKSGTTETSGQA